MREHQYWVYIMASELGSLYIGVTDDLRRRVFEHTHDLRKGFAKNTNVTN